MNTMEDNFRIKQYIIDLEEELKDLRAYKQRTLNRTPTEDHSLFSTKFVEMSRKNRNMVAELESLKSNLKKLVIENEKLQNFKNFESAKNDVEKDVEIRPEELILSSQQLTTVTNKMIEYRRQCQQMKIEIRNLSKALSLEIGEGVTPQTLTNAINSSNWRGRQQQIITLQEKVSELNSKLNHCQCQQMNPQYSHHNGGAGEGYVYEDNEDESYPCDNKESTEGITLPRLPSAISTASSSTRPSRRPFMALHQQQMRKHEIMNQMATDLTETKEETQSLRNELQASKARCQTLEGQIKSFRHQVNELSNQLKSHQNEWDNTMKQNSSLQKELQAVKDREKSFRDKNSGELQELQRALFRERATNNNLQKAINDHEVSMKMLENDKNFLKQKLDAITSSSCDDLPATNTEIANKIAYLENQLSQAARLVDAKEKECNKLMTLLKESVKDAEDERNKCVSNQIHLSKAFTVIERADQCILECLDGAQVCNEGTLSQVEDTRALIRELKIGEFFSLEMNTRMKSSDIKSLNTMVNMLKKEKEVLQNQLHKTSSDRKKDLQNFNSVTDEIRKQYLSAFPLEKYLSVNDKIVLS